MCSSLPLGFRTRSDPHQHYGKGEAWQIARSSWPAWSGLGWGHGRLKQRELQIVASGRGAATRPKASHLPMPLPAIDAALEHSSIPLDDGESWTASA